MRRDEPKQAAPTFLELAFDTGTRGAAQLGDVAASLVSLDELLRDLASIAAYSSGAEFRKIEIVSIEMRSPLRVKLALWAITSEAISAFQEICRDVILFREGRRRPSAHADAETGADQSAHLAHILERCLPPGEHAAITTQEVQRLLGHVITLQNAAIPLKRVELTQS